ncbi:MAG: hypothetical protein K8F52_04885 [Candidatus Scalindua rubra]|nr:hypothetical protein [Candidatus Scalindua rubra]
MKWIDNSQPLFTGLVRSIRLIPTTPGTSTSTTATRTRTTRTTTTTGWQFVPENDYPCYFLLKISTGSILIAAETREIP